MKTLLRSFAVASLLALASGAPTGIAFAAGAAGSAAAGKLAGPASQVQTVQGSLFGEGGRADRGPRERWIEGEGRRDWRGERPRGDWRDSRPPRERWDGPRPGWDRPGPPPHWRRPPPYYGPGPGIYFEFGNEPRYYRREPRYRNVRPARRLSAAHVRWCERRYRSYRAWDNTFQPYGGPRQQCWSPYS